MTIEGAAVQPGEAAAKLPAEKAPQQEAPRSSRVIEAAAPTLKRTNPDGLVTVIPGNRSSEAQTPETPTPDDPTARMQQLAAGEAPEQKAEAGETAAQKTQREKMEGMGLSMNIGEDSRYQDLVDAKRKELDTPEKRKELADRYSGYSEDTDYFLEREARIQALDEFAGQHKDDAELYEGNSVWFDKDGNPDSSRDLYYERAGKIAEDETRRRLLDIEPDPIYKQHVEGDGDEEGHRESQRLYDMQRQFPEIYLEEMGKAYGDHKGKTSSEVQKAYEGQQAANVDTWAGEQLDWWRENGEKAFDDLRDTVYRSHHVKALLGKDAPQVKDDKVIRWHKVIDTLSPEQLRRMGIQTGGEGGQQSAEQAPSKGLLLSLIELLMLMRELLSAAKPAAEPAQSPPASGEPPLTMRITQPKAQSPTKELAGAK